MGIFNFFSKDKKETLDQGLSKTKESVFSKISRAVAGKSKLEYRDWETDRKSTRLNSSHITRTRMPSSA